jgi:hypothetical protein
MVVYPYYPVKCRFAAILPKVKLFHRVNLEFLKRFKGKVEYDNNKIKLIKII